MPALRGILLMLASVTLFTVMTAFIKAADRVPTGQAVFFRAFLSVPILLVWFGARGQITEALRTSNLWGHASRGLVGTTAMALSFAGLKYLPLPEVTALKFVTPILIVIFAAIMLGERIRLIRVSAVLVGLLGVVVILAPRLSASGNQTELIGAFIVLASASCAAFAQIFVKRLTGSEHPAAIVFYFALTASVLSLFTIPFGWVWLTPSEWTLLIGAGTIGVCGQLLLTNSYKHAEASVLAPFTYVSMLWSVVIGFIWFDEIPTLAMLAGSALIMASGLVIVWRERQLGRGRTAERKVRAKGLT